MTLLAYVDTSALLKLVLPERHSDALRDWMTERDPALVSSLLLHTEARRAVRHSSPEVVEAIRTLVAEVADIPVTRTVCDRAAELPPAVLRSLDAIHVASALELGDELDVVLTYDERMADAARLVGLAVASPGVP